MMLVESSNDAAYALAAYAKASGLDFVALMNQKAWTLGMHDCTFSDPAGLDDTAYCTADDIIRLVRGSLRQTPQLWPVMATQRLTVLSADGRISHAVVSTNELFDEFTGIIGGKTGNSDGALGCMLLVVNCQISDTRSASFVRRLRSYQYPPWPRGVRWHSLNARMPTPHHFMSAIMWLPRLVFRGDYFWNRFGRGAASLIHTREHARQRDTRIQGCKEKEGTPKGAVLSISAHRRTVNCYSGSARCVRGFLEQREFLTRRDLLRAFMIWPWSAWPTISAGIFKRRWFRHETRLLLFTAGRQSGAGGSYQTGRETGIPSWVRRHRPVWYFLSSWSSCCHRCSAISRR